MITNSSSNGDLPSPKESVEGTDSASNTREDIQTSGKENDVPQSATNPSQRTSWVKAPRKPSKQQNSVVIGTMIGKTQQRTSLGVAAQTGSGRSGVLSESLRQPPDTMLSNAEDGPSPMNSKSNPSVPPSDTPSSSKDQKVNEDVQMDEMNDSAVASPTEAGKGGKTAGKPKRAMNAYMFFVMEKRAEIKENNPDLGMGGISKKLAEMWRALPEDDKKKYKEAAEADKARAAAERALITATRKTPKRAKTAYMLFSDAKRSEIKAANPEAGFGEVQKLLSSAWQAADEDEKNVYIKMHEEERRRMNGNVELPKKGAKRGRKPGGSAKKKGAKRRNSDSSELDSTHIESSTVHVPEEEEEVDGFSREDVDWEAKPAEHVVCETLDGKFLVKRVASDYTGYGVVDSKAAKRQRLGDEPTGERACPVTLDMLQDYEDFHQDFWKTVRERTKNGVLELDDLEEDSPLEMCYYLGKLQEFMGPLSKVSKAKGENDIAIKVPMLGLSMTVQRVVELERFRGDKLEERVKKLEAENRRLKGEMEIIQMANE